MSWVQDPELEELLSEPGLREAVRLLSESTPVRPVPDPVFRSALRRRLVEEAAQRRSQVPWWRRTPAGIQASYRAVTSRARAPRLAPGLAGMTPSLAWLSPPRMAAVGAGVGVALVALALVMFNGEPSAPSGGATVVQYRSPLDNAQAVGLVSPIDVTFNQPMDHRAVERAVRITPATRVTYQWRGNTLEMRPVNRLNPNTHYQVTVSGTATSAGGRRLGGAPTVAFTTGSQPSSTPGGGIAVSAPGLQVGGAHQLAVAGDAIVRWSSDGSTVYLVDRGGRLESMPASGGSPQLLSSGGGVTMIAVGPSGVAYVQNGDVHYEGQTLDGVDPLAIGFRSSRLLLVKGQSVEDTDGDQLATLSERPKAAEFSSSGGQLAYLGASGLHLVNVGSGDDRSVGSASSLGGWSPDGRRYAFLRDGGLYVTDGEQTTRLTDASGVTGVSWSTGGQLLLAGSGGLQIVNPDGSRAGSVSGAYAQPQWSPGGSTFAFKRGDNLWVGQYSGGHRRSAPGQTPTSSDFPRGSTSPEPSVSPSSGVFPSPSSSASPSGTATPCPSPGAGSTEISGSAGQLALCAQLSASPGGRADLTHRQRSHSRS